MHHSTDAMGVDQDLVGVDRVFDDDEGIGNLY
jgi:hypothetical protein